MKSKIIPIFFLAIGLGFTAVLASVYSDAGVLYRKRERTQLPVLGDAPTFELTDVDGKTITRESLAGNVWTLNFFFTSCEQVCPALIDNVRAMQAKFPLEAPLRAVAISVDPKNDTAERRKAYMAAHELLPARWHLLSGPIEEVRRISEKDLKAVLGEDVSLHSTRVFLVDGNGKIRGSYLGLKPDDMEKLRKDARTLSRLLTEANAAQG